jgi:glycosyltransferase involved in cell wall biosynthesis
MGFFALFVNLFHRIPYIVTEHTSPFRIYHDSFIKKIFSLLVIKRAKFILPVSRSLKKEMQVLYDTKRYVIVPNIVNSMFFPVKKTNKDFHSKKNIIHVSLLNDSQKNISGIIRAVEEVSKKREDFRLQIVGEGSDRKELEIQAGKFGLLNSRVIFSGRLNDEQLIESYRNSCFFILNSYHETFAIVCAEALACGIPVVSTRCGGPEEYVDEKMGLLIDVNSHSQLVSAIHFMLDHHQDYDPQYLHDSIRSKFSLKLLENRS